MMKLTVTTHYLIVFATVYFHYQCFNNCANAWRTTTVLRRPAATIASSAAAVTSSSNQQVAGQRRTTGCWWIHHLHHRKCATLSYQRSTNTILSMGLMDSLSNFLNNREGDFIKLDNKSGTEFGPGPALILYDVPNGIVNDEIYDMIEDGAPTAFAKQVTIYRTTSSSDDDDNNNNNNNVLDMSVQEALEYIVKNNKVGGSSSSSSSIELDTSSSMISTTNGATTIPVLFFSGFRNDEMMSTYNILGQEIYAETGGIASPACAKAVPNAMNKPLRQVFEEISGDHKDAMALNSSNEE